MLNIDYATLVIVRRSPFVRPKVVLRYLSSVLLCPRSNVRCANAIRTRTVSRRPQVTFLLPLTNFPPELFEDFLADASYFPINTFDFSTDTFGLSALNSMDTTKDEQAEGVINPVFFGGMTTPSCRSRPATSSAIYRALKQLG